MKVEYERVAPKHLDGIKRITQRAWYPYEKEVDAKFTDANVSMDVNLYLHASSWGMVALVDGEVEGVVLVHSPNSLNSLAKYGNSGAEESLILLQAPDKFRNEYIAFSKAYRDLYKKMKSASDIQADAEINLLAVNPEVKGMGIGGTLFRYAIDYLKKENAKYYWIKTDTDCDYQFYDYKGLRRVGSNPIDIKEQSEATNKDKKYTCFLYVGEIK